MNTLPTWTDLALFTAGFVSWVISTLAAGGGSVLIVAAVTVILRGQSIAPVVTMASALASPARMILLWRWIDWRVVRWYLPGAAAGALLGGWVFSRIGTNWLQIVLAWFLISRLAISDGCAAPIVRDALAMVPAGVVCIGADIGSSGREWVVGESVLPQLRADEGDVVSDPGSQLAGNTGG